MDASITEPHMFMSTSKQGQRDVTSFYNKMVAWWQELNKYNDDVWESQTDLLQHKKREANDRVFMLLAGINKNMDEAKSRILGHRPLPSIRDVFSKIQVEESCTKKMSNSEPTSISGNDTSALFVKGANSNNDKNKKPLCDFCKKYWHIRETC
uniref:Uncharacterized protein n=1 Tax=Cannabis sativa TaxID=3483 RepID=A0A803Q6L9_CANSA